MKTIFRNTFLTIDLYWKGIVLGIFWDEGDLQIILPFFKIQIIPKLVPSYFFWGLIYLIGVVIGVYIWDWIK